MTDIAVSTPDPERLPAMPKSPVPVRGVEVFAEGYDWFLVDQWGVLHDGRAAFPEAADCLLRLRAMGKRVAILSNSGRRAANSGSRLEALGIGEDGYDLLITSGELARHCLESRSDPFPKALGDRCLLLAGGHEESLLDGLRLEPAASAADADFVLLAGVDDDLTMTDYGRLLEPALTRGLPLICANPDRVRFSPRGLTFSAGEVALFYQGMGGTVRFIGKPDPLIYDYCRSRIPDFAPERAVAIGDSLHHDIGGGQRAGLATAFVMDGVHRDEFAGLESDAARMSRLAVLAAADGVRPDWVIPRFRW